MALIWLLFYTNQLLHMFIMDIITYMYKVHIDSLNLKAQKHMLPVVAYIELWYYHNYNMVYDMMYVRMCDMIWYDCYDTIRCDIWYDMWYDIIWY